MTSHERTRSPATLISTTALPAKPPRFSSYFACLACLVFFTSPMAEGKGAEGEFTPPNVKAKGSRAAASKRGQTPFPNPLVELTHADPQRRLEALRQLRYGGTYRDDSHLTSLLLKNAQDPSPDVKMAAFSVLGTFKCPEAIPLLKAALSHSTANLRRAAVEALGGLGTPDLISVIHPLLNDSDSEVRVATVQALGAMGAPSLPFLRKALADVSGNVKRCAVNEYVKLGGEALPFLEAILNDHDPAVRQSLLTALQQLGHPQAGGIFLKASAHKSPAIRELAVQGMSRLRQPEHLPVVIQALNDSDPTVKVAAVQGVGKWGDPQALTRLTLSMKDADPRVRAEAVLALSQDEAFAALPAFKNMINDPDPAVRQAVATRLSQDKDPAVIPIRLKAMAGLNVEGRRRIAAEFIEWLEDGVPPLCDILNDTAPEVRGQALEALLRIGLDTIPDPKKPKEAGFGSPDLCGRVVNAVGNLLDKESLLANRVYAVHVLKYCGPEALTLLSRALQAADQMERCAAVVALGNLKTSAALPLLLKGLDDKEYLVQYQSIASMGEYGDAAIPAFRKALLHSNPQVREDARHWMDKLGVSASLLNLMTMLAEDQNPVVRAAAAEALGESGNLKALSTLEEALNDPEASVKTAAKKALNTLKGLEDDESQPRENR